MIKTSSITKKRFKVTGTGKLLRRKASRGHKLSGKSEARKRQFSQYHQIDSKKTIKTIKRLLGV